MRGHPFPRDSDGLLSALVWPGGYSIRYLMEDGATVCAECANEPGFHVAAELDAESPDPFLIVSWYVHGDETDEDDICANCNALLRAYEDDVPFQPDDEVSDAVAPPAT
jgi:hypothetical protein